MNLKEFYCINNDKVSDYLTIGKLYSGSVTKNISYLEIFNNLGQLRRYPTRRFATIEQYRNIVINSILD